MHALTVGCFAGAGGADYELGEGHFFFVLIFWVFGLRDVGGEEREREVRVKCGCFEVI